MNYLEQIVWFHRWKEVNPLPASAIALWHELMAVCNKAGWIEEFTVPNAVLQSNAGVSRKEFDRARQILTDLGLINYKKSNRVNNAGKYSLNKFPIVQKGQRNGQQEGEPKGQQEGQPAAHEKDNERGTLFKLKETELNVIDLGIAKDRLLKLINTLGLKNVGVAGLDTVYFYIGRVEIEVIEKALKMSSGKYINYFVEIINGFIENGKITAESINPIPKGGGSHGKQGDPAGTTSSTSSGSDSLSSRFTKTE